MRLPPEDHSRSKKRLREGSDPELIYYLFHVHHWTPEQFSTMSRGAQDLVWGLASYESGNH